MTAIDKRNKRLAKNELIRKANKEKAKANKGLPHRPLTTQTMMPKGN